MSVGAPVWRSWLCISVVLQTGFVGQTSPGRCKERGGAKYCAGGTFWEFLVDSQQAFPGAAENHGISGNTRCFKGECSDQRCVLAQSHEGKVNESFSTGQKI